MEYKYLVTGGGWHCNNEDGALGYVVSQHRSRARAVAASDKYNKAHREDCVCGGGQVWVNAYQAWGKAYRREWSMCISEIDGGEYIPWK